MIVLNSYTRWRMEDMMEMETIDLVECLETVRKVYKEKTP
jgi:hypothetical protein